MKRAVLRGSQVRWVCGVWGFSHASALPLLYLCGFPSRSFRAHVWGFTSHRTAFYATLLHTLLIMVWGECQLGYTESYS